MNGYRKLQATIWLSLLILGLILAVPIFSQPARDYTDPIFHEEVAWRYEMIVVVLDRDSTTEAERASARERIYTTPNVRAPGRAWTKREPVWGVTEDGLYSGLVEP